MWQITECRSGNRQTSARYRRIWSRAGIVTKPFSLDGNIPLTHVVHQRELAPGDQDLEIVRSQAHPPIAAPVAV